MISSIEGAVRWKHPEYTGENRCIPCTVVNLLITAVLAIGIGAVSVPFGAVAAVVGVAAIYFRGYLVPGTPTLTKRYLPDRILRLFDKHEEHDLGGDAAAPADPEAVEAFFVDAGVLESCRDGTDLCLTASFRDAWRDRTDELNREADSDDAIVEPLFEELDADGSITTLDRTQSFAARIGGQTAGKWESRAAALADSAADSTLHERVPAWADLPYRRRMELLGALRLWLDRCPDCEGAVTLDEETVESCCRSYEVVAATCDDCGARLFEAELPDELA
jgi:hypothetical protein